MVKNGNINKTTTTNPFATKEDDEEAKKAKNDRKIEKLCVKLDKAGIDKKLVDTIQEKMTSEEFERIFREEEEK